MRLVDADKSIHALANDFISGKKTLGQVIDEQPTSYDVNLVVKKLEEEKTIAYDDSIDEKIRVKLWNKAIGNVIKIVEGDARTK